MQRFSGLGVRKAVGQSLPSRADIGVIVGDVGEVGTVEATMGGCVGGVRLGNGDRDSGFFARHDLLALVIPLVGNRLHIVTGHNLPCCMRHHRQGVAIVAEVGHFVRDDQMMPRLYGSLHIVTNHAGLSARRSHGADIGIGQ